MVCQRQSTDPIQIGHAFLTVLLCDHHNQSMQHDWLPKRIHILPVSHTNNIITLVQNQDYTDSRNINAILGLKILGNPRGYFKTLLMYLC